MNNVRKWCIIQTPVHIGDAMFLADGIGSHDRTNQEP